MAWRWSASWRGRGLCGVHTLPTGKVRSDSSKQDGAGRDPSKKGERPGNTHTVFRRNYPGLLAGAGVGDGSGHLRFSAQDPQ